MRSIRHAIIAALLLLGAVPAAAQSNYPERNIRLLFGFTPGADTDERLLADKLAEAFGKAVIVENVTGAGGNIAADRIAKARPDGYTIGLLANTNIVVNVSLYGKLSYDPVKDLAPITQFFGFPNVLVINNEVPAKSVKELVELARAQPGKLTFGHSGPGTPTHLSGELVRSMARIDLLLSRPAANSNRSHRRPDRDELYRPWSRPPTDTGGKDQGTGGDIAQACTVRSQYSNHG
jgi:tripartite-type tricarboxylate transporter receptor subunit TctC